MKAERAARIVAVALAVGLPLAALGARWLGLGRPAGAIEVRGVMAESGGWAPADLTATVGQPLRLSLTSDDVMHGLAVGQTAWPAVDVRPGEVSEATFTFDRPGKYVFYCTRWCGPGHWRMRGTIEVSGPGGEPAPEAPPLYEILGIDIDSPHPAPADIVPGSKPSAARGSTLSAPLPEAYLSRDYYRGHSPAQAWQALRAEPALGGLADAQIWDLVAFVWRSNTTADALAAGETLYAANCAACHGETGSGDGVMARSLGGQQSGLAGHGAQDPASFADPARMLGASPALLQGKIIRGGMGTGMPYWGPIFTEAQTWALVDYLWTFQMEYDK